MGGGRAVFDETQLYGRNRSWLGGRSLTGPHLRGLLFSSGTIAVAAGIAFGITFPWMLRNHTRTALALLSVFSASLAVALVAGFLTGTTDPGIIPRSVRPPPDIQRNPARPRERRLMLRGRMVVIKYCETCHIWRPPHTSHCSTCDNCVERFDHHCPYCSGCIGRRNYRAFLTFISATAVLSVTALASAIIHLVLKTRDFQKTHDIDTASALGRTLTDGPTAANIIVIIVSFLGLAFTGGLTGFHVYLMWNNMTTAESFKKKNRNSSCDADDLRGLAAIWYLISLKRPDSRVTTGYVGPAYPDATEIAALIQAQDEEEQYAENHSRYPQQPPLAAHMPLPAHSQLGGLRPPITGGRVPSASSRVAKLSAGFTAEGGLDQ